MDRLIGFADWYLANFWEIFTKGIVIAAIFDLIIVFTVGWVWWSKRKGQQ